MKNKILLRVCVLVLTLKLMVVNPLLLLTIGIIVIDCIFLAWHIRVWFLRHPLSDIMKWCILIFTAAVLIFFPTLQFLMTKVVLDVESRRDRVGLKNIWHFIFNMTQKDLTPNKYTYISCFNSKYCKWSSIIIIWKNDLFLHLNVWNRYALLTYKHILRFLFKHNVSSTVTNVEVARNARMLSVCEHLSDDEVKFFQRIRSVTYWLIQLKLKEMCVSILSI